MNIIRFFLFGLMVMSAASVFAEVAAPIVLKEGATTVQLSAQTGAIQAINGVVAACNDRYSWFDGQARREGAEAGDVVTDVRVSDNGTKVSLICKNQTTKLNLKKEYAIQDRPVRLVKRIEFSGADGFVRYDADVAVTEAFRAGAYYHKPVWHSTVPPKVAAEEVRQDYLIGGPWLASLVNPEQKQLVTCYRLAVDDQSVFVYGQAGEGGQWYTANGWRTTYLTAALGAGKTPSVTVAYEARPGDEYDFHLELMSRPEMVRFGGPQAGKWATEVALEGGWDDSYLAYLNELKEVAERLPWGYLLWTHWGWFAPYYGDYASRATDIAPGTRNPEEVRKNYDRVKQLSRNIKVGCYVLPGVVNAGSRFAKEHPEWLVRGRDGQPVPAGVSADYAQADPTLLYQLAAPGVLEHWQDRIEGMVTRLGADYVYIDGGVSGQSVVDWPRKWVAQDYDWYKLWRQFQAIPQAHGGLLWSNGPANVYTDAGYHECNWYPMYKDDWKVMTDRLVFSRIYRRPGKPLGVVGFVWNGRPEHPATRLAINWWFVHNITPSYLDVKGKDQLPAIRAALPYIMAAYQLRKRELVQANVSPRWQDEESDVEVHAQKIAGAGLLSVMNHGAEKPRMPIETDVSPLGLKVGQPLYVWQFSLRPYEKLGRMLTGPAKIQACFDAALVKSLDKAPKRLSVEIKAPEELAQLVVLTQVPAVIAAVEGQECPLLLPETLGVKVSGLLDKDAKMIHLSVRTGKKAEIMVLWPEWATTTMAATIHPTQGAIGTGVCEGSRLLTYKVETIGNQPMARFAVPDADCEIMFEEGRGK